MPGSVLLQTPSFLFVNARLLRRYFRRTVKILQYGRKVLAESPVLFANSFPKSGTHLLTQILAGFSQIGPAVVSGLPAIVTFRGDSGDQRQLSEIFADVHRLQPGDIAYGHIHAIPETIDWFLEAGFAAYFILRDPRDVAVSHVHYLTSMAPNHIHHRYFKDELRDFDTRLTASIQGLSVEQLDRSRSQETSTKPLPLPDIRSRFEPYLGWLDHGEILDIRYEDFISNCEYTVTNVLDHAVMRGFQPRFPKTRAVEVLLESINPSRSPTFRSGKSGGWREAFTPAHKQIFKQVCGDLLIRLGYEKDENW